MICRYCNYTQCTTFSRFVFSFSFDFDITRSLFVETLERIECRVVRCRCCVHIAIISASLAPNQSNGRPDSQSVSQSDRNTRENKIKMRIRTKWCTALKGHQDRCALPFQVCLHISLFFFFINSFGE